MQGQWGSTGAPAGTTSFQPGDAERLDFPEEYFDLVFSVDVIHHIGGRLTFFREAHRILRAGGRVCKVMDCEWIIRRRQPLAVYFPEIVEHELGRCPRIAELGELMREAGIDHLREQGVEFACQLSDIQAYPDKAYSSLHLIP